MWRERIGNISRDDRVKIREPEDISYKVESAEVNYFPSPTLSEILAKIPAAISGVGVLELALDDRAENNDSRYVICYNRYGMDGGA